MKRLVFSHLFISFVLFVTLPACGMVKTVTEMYEQTQAISATIEKKMGTKPLVSYNINNGATEIIVYFENLDNQEMTVAELKNIVRQSVAEHLKKDPQLLHLTINAIDSKKE